MVWGDGRKMGVRGVQDGRWCGMMEGKWESGGFRMGDGVG